MTLVNSAPSGSAAALGALPGPYLGRGTASQGELVPVGALGAGTLRVDGVRAGDHVVVDAVLRVWRDRRPPEQPGHVGLVLAEQHVGHAAVGPAAGDQLERPEERVLDSHRGIARRRHGWPGLV